MAERFEAHRTHLRGVAYRMLGSLDEADDAVQESWLRLSRAGADGVENLGGWLTTVVGRVCLDMLRSRRSRREEPLEVPEKGEKRAEGGDPEREAVLADSVGLALLVLLETLAPAERVAFVLHDLFAVPFEEIGTIVGRSPAAARQLASRARRRMQGAPAAPDADLAAQRGLVEAFITALRGGDFEGLVAVLDPSFVIRVDAAAAATGKVAEVQGAREWAKQATAYSQAARLARLALINGAVGLVVAPRGKLFRALCFTITGGKIARMDVIADPAHLKELDLALLPEGEPGERVS